jgi:hypothetical protein
MDYTINIPITVTREQALAVLETAEPQMRYWETPFRSHKYDKYGDYGRLLSLEVECVDSAPIGGKVGDWAEVNVDTINLGLFAIVHGNITNCRNEIIQLLADNDIDGCDIDQADAIVQAGLFGELVYV